MVLGHLEAQKTVGTVCEEGHYIGILNLPLPLAKGEAGGNRPTEGDCNNVSIRFRFSFYLLVFCLLFVGGIAQAQRPTLPLLSEKQLLDEIQHRAFLFFWEKSDSHTGLTNDRAKNSGQDDYTVASTASTGYALASLPIAVQHRWIARKEAYNRALLTLTFLNNKLPNVHGWFYHFIDKRTGERVWNCELSSIDTVLLVAGALVAGQYWRHTEVERLANALYERLEWNWMRTNGGLMPSKQVVSMGWKPEDGFIKSNWDTYCELKTLYLLGMGSKRDPLPEETWNAWTRNPIEYKGMKTLAGGPIFFHQMAFGFYDFRNWYDSQGWNYAYAAEQGIKVNRQFCIDLQGKRKTYAPNIWGLNANDAPDGYRAYAAPGEEDGTVSPTGAVASVPFTPKLAKEAAVAMYKRYGHHLWGRYGFGNAFNVDKNWFDPDVIGIDLGMALLAIENHQSGMVWKLLASHPSTKRAWELAGFHRAEGVPRLKE